MDVQDIIIHRRGLSKQTTTQAICDEMHAIAKACKNHLTPEAVLKNARKESSPIHNCFEWDDTAAGEKFRYLQACMLIRSVKVSVETHPQDKPKVIRAFVSVVAHPGNDDSTNTETEAGEGNNCYVPLEVALNTPNYRDQMLENAFRELRSFQRKYSILKELASVFNEIERLAINPALLDPVRKL